MGAKTDNRLLDDWQLLAKSRPDGWTEVEKERLMDMLYSWADSYNRDFEQEWNDAVEQGSIVRKYMVGTTPIYGMATVENAGENIAHMASQLMQEKHKDSLSDAEKIHA